MSGTAAPATSGGTRAQKETILGPQAGPWRQLFNDSSENWYLALHEHFFRVLVDSFNLLKIGVIVIMGIPIALPLLKNN